MRGRGYLLTFRFWRSALDSKKLSALPLRSLRLCGGPGPLNLDSGQVENRHEIHKEHRRNAENAAEAQRVSCETHRIRSRYRAKTLTVLILTIALLFHTTVPSKACGPETMDPIFVFEHSPDLPFDEFVKGNIGVLQQTFGRKTLVIAYRYLSGGTFPADEQTSLVEALKGKAPEEDDDVAIREWIKARKEVLPDEKETPSIYDERRRAGYDFFPNCTRNAFEVATQTLKDRATTYGADNANVRDWLAAQDIVFRNCAEGAAAPAPAPGGSPVWLQKDRDYQIAAAAFYSLDFQEALRRFQKISEDYDSVWQEVSAYLIGRTLVREASLTADRKKERALYEQAETTLLNLTSHGGKFERSSKGLLGLVKYRLHPEERVRELAQVLGEQSGNENLRQDLIDYTWLLDKFDAEIKKAEEERNKSELTPSPEAQEIDPARKAQNEAIDRGEIILLYFTPRNSADKPDYTKAGSLMLKADLKDPDVFAAVEINLGRKLSDKEKEDVSQNWKFGLQNRQWSLSPNRKISNVNAYEGCDWDCNKPTLKSFPAFLRADELTDWVLTFQSHDAAAFTHAYNRWRETHSTAWLVVAMTKAQKSSTALPRLVRESERIDHESPAFPTVAYHLIRLHMEMNDPGAAKQLLDQIIDSKIESLPISSQNLFFEQRLKLADSLSDFLKFASRKPAAFYEYGSFGRVRDLFQAQKSFWDTGYEVTKEQFDQEVEAEFAELLPWDERKMFTQSTAEIFNWHFPVASLLKAYRDPALPDYLRRSMAVAVWTRAVLLKNDTIAREAATDLTQLAPEMSSLLKDYLEASTAQQRSNEALYIILKYPNLSPWLSAGIPEFTTSEKLEYYFDTSWWCRPSDTDYTVDGIEVPKVVPSPGFLSAQVVASAKRERTALIAIDDAKSFLGKRVLEWSRQSLDDPRLPEALFIAVRANQEYKYGCGGWQHDEETRMALEKVLREKYPNNPWTVKLDPPDNR